MLRAEAPAFVPGQHSCAGDYAAGIGYAPPPPTAASMGWWCALQGECCPISLTPLEELDYEPFGLVSGTGAEEPCDAGIWGAKSLAALRRHSVQAVHWFDGASLAEYLVTTGRFINPVNRRALSRCECQSLDQYLETLGLAAARVAEAYDIASVEVTAFPSPGFNDLESATLARMRRSAAGQRERRRRPGPPTGLVTAAAISPDHSSAVPMLSTGGPGPWPRTGVPSRHSQRRVVCTRRTVHSEGGLMVVDDDDFEESVNTRPGPEAMTQLDPTPAQSLSLGCLGAGRGSGLSLGRSMRASAR